MLPKETDESPERSERELITQQAKGPEEQEELDQMLREIHGQYAGTLPTGVRYAGLALAIFTFLALGLLTTLLSQDVPFETRIYGPKELKPGSSVNYRIALFEREKIRFLKRIKVKMWLLGNKHKKLIFKGYTHKQVLLANVHIPLWPHGKKYQLRVSAAGPNGTETFSLPVELLAQYKTPPSYAQSTNKRFWESKPNPQAPYRYKLYAEGRGIIADLSNKMLLKVQERIPLKMMKPTAKQPTKTKLPSSRPTSQPSSRPHPTTKPHTKKHQPTSRDSLSRKLLQPFAPKKPILPSKSRTKPPAMAAVWRTPKRPLSIRIHDGNQTLGPFATDSRGFAHIPYMPQFLQVDWTIEISGLQGKNTFQQRIKPEGYQLLMELSRTIIAPGEALSIRVESLIRKGVFHFDLVQEGRRIWSKQVPFVAGKVKTTLHFPKNIKGLVTIQAYSEFYNPGEVYDSRLLYIGRPTPKKLLEELEQHLSQRGDGMRMGELDFFRQKLPAPDQVSAWAKQAFSIVKARFIPPPLLYNSYPDRLRKLRTFQINVRDRTLFGLGGLAGAVIFGIFGWLAWGYRQDRIAMQQSKDEHVDLIGTRGLPWLFGFAVLLLLLFACILYLFFTMQWTYDNL